MHAFICDWRVTGGGLAPQWQVFSLLHELASCLKTNAVGITDLDAESDWRRDGEEGGVVAEERAAAPKNRVRVWRFWEIHCHRL